MKANMDTYTGKNTDTDTVTDMDMVMDIDRLTDMDTDMDMDSNMDTDKDTYIDITFRECMCCHGIAVTNFCVIMILNFVKKISYLFSNV
jgi:hypothetical protein